MRTTRLLAQFGALSATFAASLRPSTLHDQTSLQNFLTDHNGRQDPERNSLIPPALDDMLDALSAMQDNFYELSIGTWPDAIDWTAAVVGTHISATLSSLISGLRIIESDKSKTECTDLLGWDNTINKYFTHLSVFYFVENAFGLRTQAYDDMLWVVLGWLENIKFAELYAAEHWRASTFDDPTWHGRQFGPLAAHRARIFYELAEQGWDERLCGGGMVWNPGLEPYKNAITNELFAAASISMYLYFPGDNNTSPFAATSGTSRPHNPAHLGNAAKTYKWLMESGMRNEAGLYGDGYHINGWRKYRNGTVDPGTKHCDEINKMVYTYNQGVLLTASRGLWLATGQGGYLEDGHELVQDVIRATGWPDTNRYWRGLGRGGVMEEFCDHRLYCNQDAQIFKSVFFHHLSEFCRTLRPQEEELIVKLVSSTGFDESIYRKHMMKCKSYGDWIEHNADAVMMTKNEDGLFGMWWGIPTHPRDGFVSTEGSQALPKGAKDWRNSRTWSKDDFRAADPNDRGRGRTVETQSGGLAVMRARWQWRSTFGATYG